MLINPIIILLEKGCGESRLIAGGEFWSQSIVIIIFVMHSC